MSSAPVAPKVAAGAHSLGLYELHVRSVNGQVVTSISRPGGSALSSQEVAGLTLSASAAATSQDATSKHYAVAINVTNGSQRDINQPLYVPVAISGYTQNGTFYRQAADSAGNLADPTGVSVEQADAATPLITTNVSPSLFNVPAGMSVTSVSPQAWQAPTLPQGGSQTVTFGFNIPLSNPTYSFNVVFGVFPTPAVNHLVLSEVYGGGGNSGTTYTHDFIEIFNPTNASINLGGYSVQYASETGTSWAVTPLTSVSLAPGQYYLVQQAKGAGGTIPLPTPDASGTILMSGSAGQVALVEGTAKITGATDASVRDYIKFTTSSNAVSFSRVNVCVDTDATSDFMGGRVNPRNSSSALTPCQ
ncbi:MAG: lamin tail domain-containing protein [Deinococcus sp.]|nr:lamin tail domain-containing protein [Deinococcus sp.]